MNFNKFKRRFLAKFLHEDKIANPVIYNKSDIIRHWEITEKELNKPPN